MGLYTRAQLQSKLSLSRHKLEKLIASRKFVRLGHDMYIEGTSTALNLAADLARSGIPVVFTSQTAMQLHRNEEVTFPIHARVPAKRRKQDSQFLVTYPSRKLEPKTVQGLPTAKPVIAAMDAFGTLENHKVARFIQDSYKHRIGKSQLAEDLGTYRRIPGPFQQFLSTLAIGYDSNLEKNFLADLRRRGLNFHNNVLIDGIMWDFQHDTEKKLLIEVGAYEFHRETDTYMGKQNYIRDVWKTNGAQLEGYTVLQFTAMCLDIELERCLDLVEEALQLIRGGGRRKAWPVPWTWHKGLIEEHYYRW